MAHSAATGCQRATMAVLTLAGRGQLMQDARAQPAIKPGTARNSSPGQRNGSGSGSSSDELVRLVLSPAAGRGEAAVPMSPSEKLLGSAPARLQDGANGGGSSSYARGEGGNPSGDDDDPAQLLSFVSLDGTSVLPFTALTTAARLLLLPLLSPFRRSLSATCCNCLHGRVLATAPAPAPALLPPNLHFLPPQHRCDRWTLPPTPR